MADVDDIRQQEGADDALQPDDLKSLKTSEKASSRRILPWIIVFFVVVLCGGAGFGLGRFFVTSRTPKPAEHPKENEPAQVEYLTANAATTDSQESWYYDLEPATANLNEPGVTRYVRVAVTLEITSDVDQNKGRRFLDEKKPLLTNWLNVYLASLTLEDTRGDRKLKRIQSRILDAFNERLFPDTRPYIRQILFKEFAVQ